MNTVSKDNSWILQVMMRASDVLSRGELTGRLHERECKFEDWDLSGYPPEMMYPDRDLGQEFSPHKQASFFAHYPLGHGTDWLKLTASTSVQVVWSEIGQSRLVVTSYTGRGETKKSETVQVVLEGNDVVTVYRESGTMTHYSNGGAGTSGTHSEKDSNLTEKDVEFVKRFLPKFCF